MRIATWNVNSIGARLPRLLDWLVTREPDAVALQETKAADSGFPYAELEDLGYEALHVGDGRWNGVAVLSRVGLTPVATELPGHPEPALRERRLRAVDDHQRVRAQRPGPGRPALRLQAGLARPPCGRRCPRPAPRPGR